MPPSYIREGFHAITVSLSVSDAEGLLSFLQQVFGAEVASRSERPDGTLGNAEVRIDDSVLELSEAREPFGTMTAALHIYVPDTDATYDKAIAAGAQSVFAPADMPYGERSAGVQDRWGNRWWLATMSSP